MKFVLDHCRVDSLKGKVYLLRDQTYSVFPSDD